ncbi:cell division control protein 2 homolog [Impatiens glandulifera]|uniref:cell division control protein 2 homolog n=1 Tax=Impatiens glandulifera TaxID=253017 RepID=UPI001FB0F138|nr:cell division control protein 2 homolog [Impatiens glandulifera]
MRSLQWKDNLLGAVQVPLSPIVYMVIPGLNPEGYYLLSKLLCLCPERRITAFDALQHPYFTNYHIFSGKGSIQGTPSKAYMGQAMDSKKPVIVKIFDRIKLNEGISSAVIREIAFLKEMDHENIVSVIDVVFTGMKIHLVMEAADMNLRQFIDEHPKGVSDRHVRKNLLYQLLKGLDYCHSQKIIHRDLRPESLMINRDPLTLKISDFGTARDFQVPVKALTIIDRAKCVLYMPPEILYGKWRYTASVDMWAAGCIFAEIARGKPLFQIGSNDYHMTSDIYQMQKILSVLGTPNEDLWPGVCEVFHNINSIKLIPSMDLHELVPCLDPEEMDLLKQMICLNPSGRIMAADALKLSYFDDLRAA